MVASQVQKLRQGTAAFSGILILNFYFFNVDKTRNLNNLTMVILDFQYYFMVLNKLHLVCFAKETERLKLIFNDQCEHSTNSPI